MPTHLVQVRSGGDHGAVEEDGWRDGMSVVCDGLCDELLISGDDSVDIMLISL